MRICSLGRSPDNNSDWLRSDVVFSWDRPASVPPILPTGTSIHYMLFVDNNPGVFDSTDPGTRIRIDNGAQLSRVISAGDLGAAGNYWWRVDAYLYLGTSRGPKLSQGERWSFIYQPAVVTPAPTTTTTANDSTAKGIMWASAGLALLALLVFRRKKTQ